ncbi:unnamed protein product [Schistosoma margrebowiei]|uniref:Uncharacterized protein n=1 Tax=Schistosoma margrebowiei TaxID=48269 RepID=A0A183LY08_9TREM|nr:unnamed protein product [Schistosoma margrebowiei]
MSSMYLPINDNWIKFQEKAESSYTENILRQKKLLMQLADQALAKYSNNQEYKNDPWLWDLDWSRPKVKCKTEVDEKVSRLPNLNVVCATDVDRYDQHASPIESGMPW